MSQLYVNRLNMSFQEEVVPEINLTWRLSTLSALELHNIFVISYITLRNSLTTAYSDRIDLLDWEIEKIIVLH